MWRLKLLDQDAKLTSNPEQRMLPPKEFIIPVFNLLFKWQFGKFVAFVEDIIEGYTIQKWGSEHRWNLCDLWVSTHRIIIETWVLVYNLVNFHFKRKMSWKFRKVTLLNVKVMMKCEMRNTGHAVAHKPARLKSSFLNQDIKT